MAFCSLPVLIVVPCPTFPGFYSVFAGVQLTDLINLVINVMFVIDEKKKQEVECPPKVR